MVTKEMQGLRGGCPTSQVIVAGGCGQHAELPVRREGHTHTATRVGERWKRQQQQGAGAAPLRSNGKSKPSQGSSPRLRGLELARGGFYIRKLLPSLASVT